MSQLQLQLRMQLPQAAGDPISLWDGQAGPLCCPGLLLLPHGVSAPERPRNSKGENDGYVN